MSGDILQEIITQRKIDVQAKNLSEKGLLAQLADRPPRRPFHAALRGKSSVSGTAAVIAEIKRGSPARGLFCPNLDPASAAQEYQAGGAACLSVLTEPRYFHGSTDDLAAARRNGSLPVLQKDFIIAKEQVLESALIADAVLLIARCLEQAELEDFYALASEHQLDVLLEVFDESDIEKIEPIHPPLVGINHRNLAAMTIDLSRSQKFMVHFTADQTVVAASGIRSRADIESLMHTGINTFLIGESLSQSPHRIEFLHELVYGKDKHVR